MKNLIARLSVLALATTGFAASTVISQAAPKKDQIKPVVIGQVCPPVCRPSDGTYCGMH